MINLDSTGSFKNIDAFLKRMSNNDLFSDLERYGRMGVDALSSATPNETGLTARSWVYKVTKSRGLQSIGWYNTNTTNGVNVAILIQYGHGTGTGGYIQGRDYINPVIQPLFDTIANEIWRKVTLG